MRLGCGLPFLTGAEVTQAPFDDAKRSPLSGSVAQVRGDLARLGDAGVSEVIAWTGAPTLDGFLAGLERFREAAG
jgi:hypothetical protein